MLFDLQKTGRVAVARGRNPQLCGVLNPIYPEVRAHWLELVRFCIDRGVDGVNLRPGSHVHAHDPENYGFNEPVLAVASSPLNDAEVGRICGDAYTAFLAAARDLLHQHDKPMGVHLTAPLGNPPNIPNIDLQWERWVREVADYAEFRGAMGYKIGELRRLVDTFTLATQAAGIPFIYQGNRRAFLGTVPWRMLEHELAYVRKNPAISAYQLYETASFMRLQDGETVQGLPGFAELIKSYRWS